MDRLASYFSIVNLLCSRKQGRLGGSVVLEGSPNGSVTEEETTSTFLDSSKQGRLGGSVVLEGSPGKSAKTAVEVILLTRFKVGASRLSMHSPHKREVTKHT
jgi:hypothetical protein